VPYSQCFDNAPQGKINLKEKALGPRVLLAPQFNNVGIAAVRKNFQVAATAAGKRVGCL